MTLSVNIEAINVFYNLSAFRDKCLLVEQCPLCKTNTIGWITIHVSSPNAGVELTCQAWWKLKLNCTVETHILYVWIIGNVN